MSHPSRCLSSFVVIAILAVPALAQDPLASGRFWSDVEPDGAALGPRAIMPRRYRALALDVAGLRQALRAVPLESAKGATPVLRLPLPGGTDARFAVVESPILEEPLRSRFPEIRTYRGQGLDDPSATLRFDLTPRGFHALILSRAGTVLIDPWRPGDTAHYVTYFKRDVTDREPFRCLADEAGGRSAAAPDTLPTGDTLRTYRLALAADGEYTSFVCLPDPPGVACALADMTTGINRVTGVYERDLAVRLTMIANEPSIIYLDPDTDPYTNGVPASMREENQANLDAVIGNPNYDIGHVFGTGGGGIAVIGGVCISAQKGRAATGIGNPVGDPFYIDYVSHEMGHHFGANHSFNGSTDFCGPNRHASTAWEPGSGSTIMSYSGLCSDENVQNDSDDYFHAGSLLEMSSFIQGIGSLCSANTPTGNALPTVSAGPDIVIPSATPFTLTATGSDADGDALTFAWEEMDLGAAGPPNTDNGNRPIFRTYLPDPSPARTLPQLQYILSFDNTPPEFPVSESLPTTTRTMQFRATVRDNRAGGGGVASDLMLANVTSAAGPFKVTQPDTQVTWQEGTTQTVTWNVANTNAAPVSCATVNVLLSLDGGQSFGTALASGTPNDGAEDITVPSTPTNLARVRVECATGPFFDVSNVDFAISPVPVELLGLTVE
jgi:Metallo-peptidase family M12B Reprolysin-like